MSPHFCTGSTACHRMRAAGVAAPASPLPLWSAGALGTLHETLHAHHLRDMPPCTLPDHAHRCAELGLEHIWLYDPAGEDRRRRGGSTAGMPTQHASRQLCRALGEFIIVF